ncbi:hypothetical protein NEL67_25850 [Escherichia coli]|nr:hypothetical protein [Escherichia coli]
MKFAFTSPAASRRWQVEAFFVSKKPKLEKTPMKQSKEQQIEQLRKQFHEQCAAPHVDKMKQLIVVSPDTLNNIVEAKIATLVEHYTDSEPIALGVQLFVRISRQFKALPPYVVVDVVCELGNLYALREEFAQVLEDMGLLNN